MIKDRDEVTISAYKLALRESQSSSLAKDARIAQLEAELAEARRDGERLDWMEARRLALNAHYGTDYGWEFVASHNVTRLFVRDVNTIDINDAKAKSGSIRTAIDAARGGAK